MAEGRSKELISVVIPAYNAQSYLRGALESVLTQTYHDFEVIVANDGSTDATQDIAERFAKIDKRVRVINGVHGGLSIARNLGVEHSRGRWVTFLDSDDRIYPEALEMLYAAATQTGCKITVGKVVREWTPEKSRISKVTTLTAVEAIRSTLYQTSWLLPSACGKLYDRKLFGHERFAEGIWYEDLDFFYRAYLEAEEIAVTDVPVYFYYKNPHGMTRRFSESRLDVLTVMERMEEYMAERIPHLLPAVRDRRMSANFNMLGILSAQKHAEYEPQMKSCWNMIVKNRRQSLLSPKTRLKNRCGALMSYLGYDMTKWLLGRSYADGGRVVTLYDSQFQEECLRLSTAVMTSGFMPDLVIGIRHGGSEVADYLGFKDAMRLDVVVGSSYQRRNEYIGNMLKYVPRPVLNLLRRIALWSKGKRNRIRQNLQIAYFPKDECCAGVEEIFSKNTVRNVLVVDDAVDYGMTMRLVLTDLRKRIPIADIRSAVITVTTKRPIEMPDYYLYNNKTLIRFPWSMDAVK